MESKISEIIRLKHHPAALVWSDQAPENAMQFKEGKWGCVMWLIANAAKGKTSVCGKTTFGCWGGGVGMGFGNRYKAFPGGEEGFCRFLSDGNARDEAGRQTAEAIRPHVRNEFYEEYLHGEGYYKNPDMVRRFVDALPMTDIPTRYVVFKPLKDVDPAEDPPKVVSFFVDPDQLSALTVLANYGRGHNENVIIPYAAGCQTIGIYPYREAASEAPRAVVGLTDISARAYIRKQLGGNLMSFTVPFALFQEMEANVAGSFLEKPNWQGLAKDKPVTPTRARSGPRTGTRSSS